MNKKRGIIWNLNVAIILVVFVIVLSLIIYLAIVTIFVDQYEEKECEKSILSHIKFLELNKIADKSPEQAPPINCPTIERTIKSDKEEVIKFELAEQMRKCWRTWQEGGGELFLKESIYCEGCPIKHCIN